MAVGESTPRTFIQQHAHEYNVWKAMRSRCYNPRNVSWKYYGAKGVQVCDRWRESFRAFLDDVGEAPSPAHQINRLDNGRGYDPGNVEWATPAEQQANTDKVRFIVCRGVELSVGDWSKISGLTVSTIRSRIDDLGWSAEDAIMTGVQKESQRKNGKRKGTRTAIP